VGLSSIARSDWLHGIDLLDITELAHRRHQRRTAHVYDRRALCSRELPSKMLDFHSRVGLGPRASPLAEQR
jgi:hypothetical protein